MNNFRVAALLLSFIAGTTAIAADLVNLKVDRAPVENGKALDMEFHELERTEFASIVEVKFRSGGSVSSSLFILRGMCAVARSRGAEYFTTKHIQDDPSLYQVMFERSPPELPASTPSASASAPDEPGGFALSDCKTLGF